MSTPASRTDVLRLRLERHGLADDQVHSPLEAVQRMLAVQSQDFAAGTWALGIRSPGTTLDDVYHAIDTGAIVRSWPMRGTLHLVPAVELSWMLHLTTPRMLASTRARRAQLGIDDGIVETARDVAVAALTGGRRLSRAGFLRALQAGGVETSDQRGYHLIWHLAQTGTLCWGPHAGTQQDLVLLSEWVPAPRRLERDEALGEFLFRYLDGHGPATLADFVWWSKLTVADAKTGLAVARDRLAELPVDDTTYYLASSADTGQLGAPPRQRSRVLLLPAFDEYLLGYRDRDLAIPPEHFERAVPGKNGIFFPVMAESGRLVGTWRATPKGSMREARAEPFERMTERRRAGFAAGIREYARFLGTRVTVTAETTDATALA